MKFFVDTADISEIEELTEAGLIDGVTTNPSLIKKTRGDFKETISRICTVTKGDVSAEVISTDTEGMLREGKVLAALSDNVVVKLPLTASGLKACSALTSEGIKTNVTLCFSGNQALVAAKAGATYISPFIGRLDDIHTEGMDLIRVIRQVYDNYGFKTEILAASIRTPMHVLDSALAGADVATVPAKVLWGLVNHPLTDKGLETFIKDAQAADIQI